MTKIKGIGLEIEAEMSQRAYNYLHGYGRLKEDVSIHLCEETKCRIQKGRFLKELNSFVYSPRQLNKIKAFFDGLNDWWEKKEFHYNDSMGFHIHISFTPKVPPEIYSAEFRQFFLKKLKEKQRKMLKTRENNYYCKTLEKEGRLAEDKSEHGDDMVESCNRYQFINFKSALEAHGTIEFRIFPTDKPLKMFGYLQFTLDTIKEFLAGDVEMKRTASLEYENGDELLDTEDGGGIKFKSRRQRNYPVVCFKPLYQEQEIKV